jgi:hypothetical protein
MLTGGPLPCAVPCMPATAVLKITEVLMGARLPCVVRPACGWRQCTK